MNTLKKNIKSLYGSQGIEWFTRLPLMCAELAHYWNLCKISPVSNMTFNYVAKAISKNKEPVVLKISYDNLSILDEQRALADLGSGGSIKLIDYHQKYNALLLQQAIPGITLKSIYRNQPDYVMDSYVETMQRLHDQQEIKKLNYLDIADWLRVFDKPNLKSIPIDLLNKAIELRKKLLSSSKSFILLHGDLHHDNILQHQDRWLAIDPKGVIGEAEFEIAAFDFMYINELSAQTDVKSILEQRVERLAQKSGLNAQRINDWLFVRLILMAAWLIEDNGNPQWAIKLAELI